jgi:hypothetical protein
MNAKEIYSEDRRLIEQVQDHIQWLAYLLTMWNALPLLSHISLLLG